jgi:hypothetical protein
VSVTADRAGEVYDLLADAPNGLTTPELRAKLNCSPPQLLGAVRAARLILADSDTVYILAEPDGFRKPWRYKLVGGGTIVNAEESVWIANRVGDAHSRIRLMAGAMAVAKRSTKPGTILGRKAREMERVLRHLVEDLDAIDADV